MEPTHFATFRDVLAGLPRGLPGGTVGDPGRFPVGSVARRINAETRLLLGGPRALLLQLAEPRVAAGVADHSDFASDPFGRLWNTLDLTLTVGFGDAEQARAAAGRIARTHAGVTGARGDVAYRATDPELLAWVHATLVDSALVTYERFVGRVGPRARDIYVTEMNAQGAAFGVPSDRLWRDHGGFAASVTDAIRALRVDDEARTLANAVLHPAVSAPVRPVGALLAWITAGLLPSTVRDAYGLPWTARDERALEVVGAAARMAGGLLPDVVRRWPHARAADARVNAAAAG
ncbi:MAG TPA: oxygenase MpaB family protein [Actinomycetota bacterium]|nr:oxygenase MpaB family protein [Actinomycetota bacterium]